jgi:hypothetical protein
MLKISSAFRFRHITNGGFQNTYSFKLPVQCTNTYFSEPNFFRVYQALTSGVATAFLSAGDSDERVLEPGGVRPDDEGLPGPRHHR